LSNTCGRKAYNVYIVIIIFINSNSFSRSSNGINMEFSSCTRLQLHGVLGFLCWGEVSDKNKSNLQINDVLLN